MGEIITVGKRARWGVRKGERSECGSEVLRAHGRLRVGWMAR